MEGYEAGGRAVSASEIKRWMQQRDVRHKRALAAREMRAQGLTWKEIGARLGGVSRSRAKQLADGGLNPREWEDRMGASRVQGGSEAAK